MHSSSGGSELDVAALTIQMWVPDGPLEYGGSLHMRRTRCRTMLGDIP